MSILPTVHPCEVCLNRAGPGKLMCPDCWRLVPAAVQRRVYSTWRAFERRRSPTEGLSTLKAYRAVRDEAIDHVRRARQARP